MFCTACACPIPAETTACPACGSTTEAARAARRRGGEENDEGRGRREVEPAARDHAPLAALPPRRPRRLVLAVAPLVALLAVGGGYYRDQRADQAAWYARAEAAVAAGGYEDALAAYTAAGGYRDAAARGEAVAAALAPYRAAYLDGVLALDAGHHDAAIAALLPVVRDLPGYADATALLAEARRGRELALEQEAERAGAAGDWLAAERALVALSAADPGDPALAARLAELRRAHAPVLVAREARLALVDPSGGAERTVADGLPAAWPVWSPDRTRIAFVVPDLSGYSARLALYVVNADGSGLTKLAD